MAWKWSERVFWVALAGSCFFFFSFFLLFFVLFWNQFFFTIESNRLSLSLSLSLSFARYRFIRILIGSAWVSSGSSGFSLDRRLHRVRPVSFHWSSLLISAFHYFLCVVLRFPSIWRFCPRFARIATDRFRFYCIDSLTYLKFFKNFTRFPLGFNYIRRFFFYWFSLNETRFFTNRLERFSPFTLEQFWLTFFLMNTAKLDSSNRFLLFCSQKQKVLFIFFSLLFADIFRRNIAKRREIAKLCWRRDEIQSTLIKDDFIFSFIFLFFWRHWLFFFLIFVVLLGFTGLNISFSSVCLSHYRVSYQVIHTTEILLKNKSSKEISISWHKVSSHSRKHL